MYKNSNEFSILQTYESKTNYNNGFEDDICKHIISDFDDNSCMCPHFEEWKSPSDLIIDLVDIQPPLTSKVTRAKAHTGIQSIGETHLEINKDLFQKSIAQILKDNDKTWKFILKNELKTIHKQVRDIFKDIFEQKRRILVKEMTSFYEKTLSELEEHVKSEVKTVAYSFHNGIITHLNRKNMKRLLIEKEDLEKKLNNDFYIKMNKIKQYYHILFQNEVCKYTKLYNKVVQERNDAVKSFCTQIESERLTSNMYVLISERKKCKVKKMVLKNIQHKEIMDNLKIFLIKDDLLKDLIEQKETIPILNRHWQEQVLKILRLLLRFISFSLKLLPEQATFLLDFEKMVILQLNEYQKQPYNPSQILVNKEDQINMFEFRELPEPPSTCDEAPFQIVGSLESPLSLFFKYGSRETIGSEADYPYFRVQKKYIYAKCHGFEKIKDMLGAKICRCASEEVKTILSPGDNFGIEEIEENSGLKVNLSDISSKTSSIHMGPDFDKVNTVKKCPNNCEKFIQEYVSSDLNTYLDYNEENYDKLIEASIDLRKPELRGPTKIKDIVLSDMPFPEVEENYKSVATQCSSHDDVGIECNKSLVCDCSETNNCDSYSKGCKMHDVFLKREVSLKRLLKTNPNLFSILFSDETYESNILKFCK